MQMNDLIHALSQPESYAHRPEHVEVIKTHSAAVFLAGPRVYKIKKPVNFGFLDYSTLARRRHFCHEEVRLNRRLAPEVYLGVVPIVAVPGGVRVGGEGEAVEWAVEMIRLDDDDTLLSRLRRGAVDPALLGRLAVRLVAFHRDAAREPEPGKYAGFAVVSGNIRENFDQTRDHIGHTVSQAVWEQVRARSEATLEAQRARITRRAEAGRGCETHGDLRLEHVYLRDGKLTVIDGIEFNERFRFADPVADVAFLVMDLCHRHRYGLGRALTVLWTRAADDVDGAALLPLYTSYRAVVRGKVAGFAVIGEGFSEDQRLRARQAASAYWMLALDALSLPREKPALLLLGGLPGTGKSTVARMLSADGHGCWIRTDAVRKSLAGIPLTESGADVGIYSEEWTQRTYDACLLQARDALLDGGRAIVDATFSDDGLRQRFIGLARELGVRVAFLECQAPPEVVRQRLRARSGDVSDADWSIYLRKRASWAPTTEATGPYRHALSTDGSLEETRARATALLQTLALA
ncbi:MAG: aminoglycoside phosphotransferase family enzyme/predicted kinase [Myxococcota bacterium]|jgi:aminoglycoside phosphotransferase family enzyme/predicted kinase